MGNMTLLKIYTKYARKSECNITVLEMFVKAFVANLSYITANANINVITDLLILQYVGSNASQLSCGCYRSSGHL